MDITHYTFTLYVFLLVCAAIWLFGRVMRKSKKEDKNGYEKEQRLFKLYQNVEDMLGMFEEYAEEAKKEIEAKLKEARELLESAGAQRGGEGGGAERAGRPRKASAEAERSGRPRKASAEAERAGRPRKASAEADLKKVLKIAEAVKLKPEDRIPEMLARGMDKNDIARELGLSVREVSLIMDIKKIRMDEGL